MNIWWIIYIYILIRSEISVKPQNHGWLSNSVICTISSRAYACQYFSISYIKEGNLWSYTFCRQNSLLQSIIYSVYVESGFMLTMIFIKDIIKWLHYKLNHQNTSCYISKLKFATAMAHCQTHGNTITSVFWSSRRRKPMHCNGWYENTWEYSWGLPLPCRSEWGGAKGSWLLSTFFAYIFYSLYILDQERLKSIAIINVSLMAHVLEVSNALNWCPRQEEAKWQNCIEVTGNILVS